MKKKIQEETGSTAIPMTYGDYLKDYPKGRKDDNAKKSDSGYCIIDNEAPRNVCWLQERTFKMINDFFSKR